MSSTSVKGGMSVAGWETVDFGPCQIQVLRVLAFARGWGN